MLLSDTITSSLRGVIQNKTRSLLTTLGIIIGVGSVVLMMSIGSSFENYIIDQIESFGGDTIDVYPTGLEKFGKVLDSITEDDYEAIQKLSSVKNVAPVIFITEKVKYRTEEISPYVFGTTKEIFGNYGLEIERGRSLTDRDVQGAKAVAVLGHQAAEDLFESRDPIGKRITIGSRQYTVVGVNKSVGSLVLQDLDSPVFVPYTIAKAATGQKFLNYITVQSVDSGELALADIKSLLRQRHQIDNPENDPDKDDFMARSAAQAAEIVGTVTLGITIFLALVAGVSLLVGGIGIMNIMLVSVTERTKEIGLRKAIGAKKRDILLQFLLEAVLLTSVGGLIGIIGSAGLGYLLSRVADTFLGEFGFAFSIPSVILAVVMAVGTGVAFGLYPAKRAADLRPLQALRYE